MTTTQTTRPQRPVSSDALRWADGTPVRVGDRALIIYGTGGYPPVEASVTGLAGQSARLDPIGLTVGSVEIGSGRVIRTSP